ncbi:MAG: hypothetical protein KatS3mg094_304 [Candidatus Parcubacteria bacterium]|nr:MAG: hypothetical protein KatS3mg094_304 [Candidatus Parcubacteria bacterium]
MPLFIFTLIFILNYQISLAQLLIKECMYNPEGNDDGREWIEVINKYQETIKIKSGRSGWKINDGENHIFKQNIEIKENEVFVIVQDKNLFLKEYPKVNSQLIEANFSLKNNEGKIQIFDDEKKLIGEVYYNKNCGGFNNGYSIIFENDTCKENKIKGGTPGILIDDNVYKINNKNNNYNNDNNIDYNKQEDNRIVNINKNLTSSNNLNKASSSLLINNFLSSLNQDENETAFNLIINEFLPNPEGKDQGNEFIELFNDSDEKINLTNFILEVGNKKNKLKGFIDPKGYFVIDNKEYKFSIKNRGENLSLFWKNDKVFSIKYNGRAPQGKSLSRDINGKWYFTEPTPGKHNIFIGLDKKNNFNILENESYKNYNSLNNKNEKKDKNLTANINDNLGDHDVYTLYIIIVPIFLILALGFTVLIKKIF